MSARTLTRAPAQEAYDEACARYLRLLFSGAAYSAIHAAAGDMKRAGQRLALSKNPSSKVRVLCDRCVASASSHEKRNNEED